MFLQETKTKRGGKTYISYLVRESFRTANGPRGRTICNLTHLPKEVRDLVGQALRGAALVPLEKLEVNNIHSCGGCVVLEEAARRYALPELLAPLSQRNAALVQAMVFGGLLFPPSMAPGAVRPCGPGSGAARIGWGVAAGVRAADPSAAWGCAGDHAVPDLAIRGAAGDGCAGNGRRRHPSAADPQ